ncbi:Uncharacterised protein [Capnocytophaga canimorsus]|nr:Uncharacterised protein [Capnocytophaga canimorsus]
MILLLWAMHEDKNNCLIIKNLKKWQILLSQEK